MKYIKLVLMALIEVFVEIYTGVHNPKDSDNKM